MEIQVIFGEKTDLPFIDVEKTDWFYDNVKYVYETYVESSYLIL